MVKSSKKAGGPVSRSGRFERGPSREIMEFSESISFDRRLWEQDLIGSMAHAAMLRRIGLLPRAEARAIIAGLKQIGDEIEAGKFPWRIELEDVHMNIESALTSRTAAGAKLHTARSRNDQVALDARLWVRSEIGLLRSELAALQSSLVTLAEKEKEIVAPGYTHLQRAQPVYLAHHLLAYVEMFARDETRLRDCAERLNECPLGSGAIAGTTLPLDREFVAKLLGFEDGTGRARLTQNSMDAVSDRDFMIEFAAALALIAAHLSRLGEDITLWASAEFNFIKIADEYTTGSSLMPQKKNPDIAELTRGKTGRVYGNLIALLTLIKGLPMTYNRDLQEDKERLFDSTDTVRRCVRIMGDMLRNSRFNPEPCARAAADPGLLATDLADYLVKRGRPFRQAHHQVGALVAWAERAGKSLSAVTLEEAQAIDPMFDQEGLKLLEIAGAMDRRELTGAPGRRQVETQLARWRKLLAKKEAAPPFPSYAEFARMVLKQL